MECPIKIKTEYVHNQITQKLVRKKLLFGSAAKKTVQGGAAIETPAK